MALTRFITGTGTGVGKTFVTRGIASALVARQKKVAALKPFETGCQPKPLDAVALGRACNHPELAVAPGFYRTPQPLAPLAASLQGAPPTPSLEDIAAAIEAASKGFDACLVEGAGGVLVPISETETMADLARIIGAPAVLVAQDGLGVLSYTLTAVEALLSRDVPIDALVLVQPASNDPSIETNARILEEQTGLNVFRFPRVADDDQALAKAAISSGLLDTYQF